jgi:hypothetical protein
VDNKENNVEEISYSAMLKNELDSVELTTKDLTNNCNCRECFYCSSCLSCEDCDTSYKLVDSEASYECFNSSGLTHSFRCRNSAKCDNCIKCHYCIFCNDSINCQFCSMCAECVDCISCTDCFDCVNCFGLIDKEGWFNNKPPSFFNNIKRFIYLRLPIFEFEMVTEKTIIQSEKWYNKLFDKIKHKTVNKFINYIRGDFYDNKQSEIDSDYYINRFDSDFS